MPLLRTPTKPLQIIHFIMHQIIKIPFPLCQTTAFHQTDIFILIIKVKLKQSRNGPGLARRVTGDLGSQIS